LRVSPRGIALTASLKSLEQVPALEWNENRSRATIVPTVFIQDKYSRTRIDSISVGWWWWIRCISPEMSLKFKFLKKVHLICVGWSVSKIGVQRQKTNLIVQFTCTRRRMNTQCRNPGVSRWGYPCHGCQLFREIY